MQNHISLTGSNMPDMESPGNSFKSFVFGNRRRRITLWIIAALIVIQFSIFKYLYPYASFIHGDSFSYINAAYQNLPINTYMIGYSKLLRLFSVFSSTDTALVIFQYLLIQASGLFFLFTLFYFYKPAKATEIILLCFMVLNPLFLYMANLVSSDCYFLALSLSWFAVMIWMIHRPTMRLIILQALILFLAFTVRYNALIYPFLAAIALGLSTLTIRKKIAGILASFILVILFVLYTGSEYKSLTGTWQYSPFSGWQVANNAMYAYRYVDSANRKPVPLRFKVLDNTIRSYFDSTRDIYRHPSEALVASTIYMWDMKKSPLYKYRDRLFAKDSSSSELRKWAFVGSYYKEYGMYIIKQYPSYYFRYFIWPNANKYYAPPTEFLGLYNSGKDSVSPIAKVWFGYKNKKIAPRTKDLKISALDFYPILSGVINVVMLVSLICFILLRGWRYNTLFEKAVFLGGAVWLLNAGFTIFASSAALRFQAFPILITFTFSLLLIDWLWKLERMKIKAGSEIKGSSLSMANS